MIKFKVRNEAHQRRMLRWASRLHYIREEVKKGSYLKAPDRPSENMTYVGSLGTIRLGSSFRVFSISLGSHDRSYK